METISNTANEYYKNIKEKFPRSSYKHPYDSHEHRITVSPVRATEFYFDWIGPEQVSPHYENFTYSRKIALTGLFGMLAMSLVSHAGDLGWMARSLMSSWVFYYLSLYLFWEGRHYMLMPMQLDWYAQLAQLETELLYANAPEDLANANRACVDEAIEQLEYMDVHKDFPWLKENAVNIFINNEQNRLHESLKERSIALLKAAESMEKSNKKNLTRKIMESALDALEKEAKNPSKEILKSTFEAGLDGIRNDKMTYKNDKLLQEIINRIRGEIKRFDKLSEQE